MTEAEAAWVREHVWTPAMRKDYVETPAIHSMCPCEYGPCGHCATGHRDRCPYTDPHHPQWAAVRATCPSVGLSTRSSDRGHASTTRTTMTGVDRVPHRDTLDDAPERRSRSRLGDCATDACQGLDMTRCTTATSSS